MTNKALRAAGHLQEKVDPLKAENAELRKALGGLVKACMGLVRALRNYRRRDIDLLDENVKLLKMLDELVREINNDYGLHTTTSRTALAAAKRLLEKKEEVDHE